MERGKDMAALKAAIYRSDLDEALSVAARLNTRAIQTYDFTAVVRGLEEIGFFDSGPLTFFNGSIKVAPEKFSLFKFENPEPIFFAIINDGKVMNEVTLAFPEDSPRLQSPITVTLDPSKAVQVEGDYRLIGFEMTLPFAMVGFMKYVSASLADIGVSVVPEGAFATDHIFVKDADLRKTLSKLSELGF